MGPRDVRSAVARAKSFSPSKTSKTSLMDGRRCKLEDLKLDLNQLGFGDRILLPQKVGIFLNLVFCDIFYESKSCYLIKIRFRSRKKVTSICNTFWFKKNHFMTGLQSVVYHSIIVLIYGLQVFTLLFNI